MKTTYHIDSQLAFQVAIDAKVLSANPQDNNFAGHYMYMYSQDKHDYFKHIDTRQYITNPVK